MKICCVFVCNKNYFTKFINTCSQLIKYGNYKGDICLVIGDDLVGDKLLDLPIIKDNNIIIKYYPNIQFSKHFLDIQKNLNRPPHWFKKIFQYHKFYLFHPYFKKWDFIFYIDCGIHIYDDISPIINEATDNKLLAHSDAYPTYNWKLRNQFSEDIELNKMYDLNNDYFQSTIMLFDTNIIEDNTFTEIMDLVNKYPKGITNDQSYLALYFTIIKPCWKQIKIKNEKTYFYDYLSRNNKNKYIMLKTPNR
tara:strand:+ start:3369 stop:4118 length:750 start_codon:yes stop_codon:yes gene_type:complete